MCGETILIVSLCGRVVHFAVPLQTGRTALIGRLPWSSSCARRWRKRQCWSSGWVGTTSGRGSGRRGAQGFAEGIFVDYWFTQNPFDNRLGGCCGLYQCHGRDRNTWPIAFVVVGVAQLLISQNLFFECVIFLANTIQDQSLPLFLNIFGELLYASC